MIIARAALAASLRGANKLFYSTPNSMEKKRLQLATKQGKRGITAESLSAAQPPATTALLEPGLKCQERTMRRDKLLSSNSCTANFQLYTQMALRLEENGVHGEDGGRLLCLFGGERGGKGEASQKNQEESRRRQGSCPDTSPCAIPHRVRWRSRLSLSSFSGEWRIIVQRLGGRARVAVIGAHNGLLGFCHAPDQPHLLFFG